MARATRSNRIAGVGELQLQVLDVLSALGEGTVYDVQAQFPEGERPRYTTVLTVLRSLEKKGLAEHRTLERQYIFRAVVSPSEVRCGLLRDVLDRVFNGSPQELVATLFDMQHLSPQVVKELKALIAQREGERHVGKKRS